MEHPFMSFRKILGTATALVAWVCVLVQLVYSVRNGLARGESVPRALANYFAYFTILTNLLVALVLTLPALAPGRRIGRAFADLRVTWTAAAAILVVGIAYHLLLRATHNPTGGEAITNIGMHYLVPAMYAAWWVVCTDVTGARWADRALHLSAYPTAYFGYIVGRGEVVGTYPYFFVDVAQLGLLGALRNAAGILVFYLVIAWLLLMAASRVGTGRLSAASAATPNR
jgi:hypothetical protein